MATALIGIDSVNAFFAFGQHFIYARGTYPDACTKGIEIISNKLDVEPPGFIVQRNLPDGIVCAAVHKGYKWEHVEVFDIGPCKKQVKVYFNGGDKLVDVIAFGATESGVVTKTLIAGGGGEVPVPLGGGGEVPIPFSVGKGMEHLLTDIINLQSRQATGRSIKFSLEDAIFDAIRQIPPSRSDYPDKLYHYTVTSIGAAFGGIVGIKELLVTVRENPSV